MTKLFIIYANFGLDGLQGLLTTSTPHDGKDAETAETDASARQEPIIFDHHILQAMPLSFRTSDRGSSSDLLDGKMLLQKLVHFSTSKFMEL